MRGRNGSVEPSPLTDSNRRPLLTFLNPGAWRSAESGPTLRGCLNSRVEFGDLPVGSALPAQSALVHARLSIIDPLPRSDQPMSTDDATLWLCYNGEVYGWEEEARRLQARGAHFRTHCDTEFILHARRREAKALP